MDWMIESLLQGTQFQKLYNRKIETLSEAHRLRKIDIDILFFLHKSGEHNTPKDISNLDLFNKGHISQSVDRLSKQGFLQVVQDTADRRCIHLLLTGQAVALVERIILLRKNMYDIILQDVTQEEREALRKVSRKVHANIRNALEDPDTILKLL